MQYCSKFMHIICVIMLHIQPWSEIKWVDSLQVKAGLKKNKKKKSPIFIMIVCEPISSDHLSHQPINTPTSDNDLVLISPRQ